MNYDEIDGVHYSFVTKPKFEELIGRGEPARSGAGAQRLPLRGPPEPGSRKLQWQGLDVIPKIEVQGAEQVREEVRPDGVHLHLAALDGGAAQTPKEEREFDSEKDIEERQRLARWEMSYAQYYDYVVTNEDAQVAADDVMEVIRMERKRRRGAASSE